MFPNSKEMPEGDFSSCNSWLEINLWPLNVMGKIIAKTAQLNFQAVVEENAAGGFPV